MYKTLIFFSCFSFWVLTNVNAQTAPDVEDLKKQQADKKKWDDLQRKEDVARVKKEIAKQKAEEAERKKKESDLKRAEQKMISETRNAEKRATDKEKARLAGIAKEEKLLQDKEKQRLKREEALATKAAAEEAKRIKLEEKQAGIPVQENQDSSSVANTQSSMEYNPTATNTVADTIPPKENIVSEEAPRKTKKKNKPKKKEKETGLDLFGPAREKQYSTPSDSVGLTNVIEPTNAPANSDTTTTYQPSSSPTVIEPESPKKKIEPTSKRAKRSAVMVSRPHPRDLARCGLVQNSVDEMTALKRMVLGDEVLFTYNKPGGNPKELKDQDLLTCISQVGNYGGDYFIKLTFYFAIPYARSEYGFIIENMPVTFITISGSTVALDNDKQIQGKVINNSSTIYEVTLPLEGKDLKNLRVAEIDRVVVNWKSGTESFEVFDVDVISRQIQCMDRHIRK